MLLPPSPSPQTRKQGFCTVGEMAGGSWETGVQVVAATRFSPPPRSLARLYYGRVAASN